MTVVQLECNNDAKNAHKFYRVETNGTEVTVYWGRIGTAGQSKTHHFASSVEAAEFAMKQADSKRVKGYVDVGQPAIKMHVGQSRPAFNPPPQHAPVPAPFGAQLAEAFDMQHIGQLIVSDDWAIEQKLDGHRLLLQGTGTGVKPLNRNGQPYAAKNLPLALGGMILPDGLIIDGELLDLGSLDLWAFDIRSTDGSVDAMSLDVRRDLLARVIDSLSLPVHLLPQATGAADKQRLVEQAIAHNAEGVVCKHIPTGYTEGRSSAWRKVKFVKSLDAVVTAVRADGKDAVTVALFDNGQLVEVGKASLIGREPVNVGDVIEVKYLYATDERRLYQPVMVRRRTDKKAVECGIDQLVFTDRKVLAL